MTRRASPRLLPLWLRQHRWAEVATTLAVSSVVLAAAGPRGQVANPLGARFVGVQAAVVIPALVCAVALLAVDDGVTAQFSLAQARLWARVTNVGALFAATAIALWPFAGSVGPGQALIDVGILLGLGLVGARLAGVVLGWGLQLLVVLPHLVRPAGGFTQPWALLAGGSPGTAGVCAAALAFCGVVVSLVRRPSRRRSD